MKKIKNAYFLVVTNQVDTYSSNTAIQTLQFQIKTIYMLYFKRTFFFFLNSFQITKLRFKRKFNINYKRIKLNYIS